MKIKNSYGLLENVCVALLQVPLGSQIMTAQLLYSITE